MCAALLGVPIACLAAEGDRPAFQSLRWEEDYRFLSDPARRTEPLDSLKYVPLPLTASGYVTLSGQLREQWLTFDAPLLGIGGKPRDDYRYQRLYLGADLHFNTKTRAFFEFADVRAFNKQLPFTSTDQNRADIQVAFADHTLDAAGGELVFRAGRQEILFDETERFLGIRDGPNVRLAFDAGLAQWKRDGFTLTAFAGSPVKYLDKHGFDDRSDSADHFGGVRASVKGLAGPSDELAAYVYRYSSDKSRHGASTAPGVKNTFGLRTAGRRDALDWEAEAVAQTGHVANERVRAWAASGVIGWTFDANWKPRIALQADLGSGDATAGDGTYRTFDPLFPKGAYFNDAALTGFANVENVGVSISVRPARGLTVEALVATVSKHVTNDFAYESTSAIPGTNTAAIKHVGEYAQLFAAYGLTRNVDVQVQVVRYWVSSGMRSVGARDTTYSKFTLDFRF